jgi:hypothetical protein
MTQENFSLEYFGLTQELGFLGPSGIAETGLPASFDPVLEAANSLSDWLTSDQLRQHLAALPDPVSGTFLAEASDAQLRAAMVR